MTPEEKVVDLIKKYSEITKVSILPTKKEAVKCAILCVQEILESYGAYKGMYDQDFFDGESKYWAEVRNHLKQMQ